jgi:hypothetical protein
MTTQSSANISPNAPKRARKREPTQTPPEWFDLFREHDDQLVRVRLLWRRGGGRYRPIVPINLALEDLDNASFEEWEDFELRESHFDWATVDGENMVERDRRIEEVARELWAVAVAWTRAKGPVCDFQLRGYGSQGEILVEDGKRCNLSGERTRYEDDPAERSGVDETVRRLMGDERSAWRHLDQVKDSLIGRLTEERGRLFDNVERASSAAPAVISNVHHLLDRAIEFHQRSVDDYVSRAGGERELEARAFAELQKTRRSEAALGFLKDAATSLAGYALPFIQILREQGTRFHSVPEFKCAQQALGYLAITLKAEQIMACMSGGSEAQHRDSAEQTLATLDLLSRYPSEFEAVTKIEPLLTSLFTSGPFRSVATPEQLITVNYIIGRAALFRMAGNEHGGG